MARPRLPIFPHLTPDEIRRRYRACRGGVEKTHWQALWLLTRATAPPTPAAVAALVGLTPAWVRTILRRWNAEGPDGLAARRPATNGGKAKLTAGQRAELYDALQQPPPDGGLWTGPKVARFVRGRWGVAVCKQTGWGWMRGLGFTLQVPRPCHPKAATAAERQAWERGHGSVDCRAAPPASRPPGRALGRD